MAKRQRSLSLLHAKKYRLAIGPGLEGAANAIAIDPSGRYLAIGGRGAKLSLAGFRDAAFEVPSSGGIDEEMRLDEGTIILIDLRSNERRVLTGHRGAIVGLRFANGPVLSCFQPARMVDVDQ